MDVLDNGTLASLSSVLLGGLILTRGAQRRRALPVLKSLNTKSRLPQEVGTLSGGNQQKVVLAKWLLTGPKVLLLDEPTRGIDVVAKQEIYQLLSRLASEGMGILLIMSELPELLAMSDRILVMRRGKLTAELTREQATPQNVTAAGM
jgi:rhamnose transport system ATP-binding protein